MASKSRIKRVSCKSANELLDALSPRGKYFGHHAEPRELIFRGQADARWPLLPSAFRVGALLKSAAGWSPAGEWTNREQIVYELATIKDFFWRVDASGLPVPEDSQELRTLLNQLTYDVKKEMDAGNSTWPHIKLLSLMALAQHHGVPTRLLDWSISAFKATYFAAIEGARWILKPNTGPPGVKRISVWALEKSVFSMDRIYSSFFDDKHPVTLITAPTASNPNLHAQDGVFTLSRISTIKPGEAVNRTPFDKELERRLRGFYPPPILYQFKLPIRETPKLLRLLAKEGVSGASLFPGFDGVVKGMKEELLWNS